MTARSSSTLPPIKFDPTIAIDINKQKKELDKKALEMVEKARINKTGPTEEERERILFQAAKLRSKINDFPEEIIVDKIGTEEEEDDE